MISKSSIVLTLVLFSVMASARVATRGEVSLFCNAIQAAIDETNGIRELNERACVRSDVSSVPDLAGEFSLEGVVQIRQGFEDDGNEFEIYFCRLKYRGEPELENVLHKSVVCHQ